MTDNLSSQLAKLPFFEGLAAAELARFVAGARTITCKKDEVLFHRGDFCEGFYMVISGYIKLAFNLGLHQEKIVDVVSPGQSFGEAVMFLEKPYAVSAKALTPTQLIFVPKTSLLEAIEHDAYAARQMIARLSAREHRLMKDIEAHSLQSARQRLVGYLLAAAEELNPLSRSVEVVLQIPKGVIASRLNMTQECLSRLLSAFQKEGVLKVRARKIEILDIEQFRGVFLSG